MNLHWILKNKLTTKRAVKKNDLHKVRSFDKARNTWGSVRLGHGQICEEWTTGEWQEMRLTAGYRCDLQGHF